MSHKYKTLPSNTTSPLPSSRASLPVLNTRRRLINRPSHSSVTDDVEHQHGSPSRYAPLTTADLSHLSPQIPIAPPKKSVLDLQRSSSPAKSLTTNNNKDISDCLKNVIVCLDIRTEDGSDVSQNFVKVVKSMGAQIRKTVAGDVTHLVYKGGSAANVKKALHNKCKIVNLLWITNCKSEGRRLPEDKYLIENPENLVLAGAKRRKSMEPGRVRALVLDDSSSIDDQQSDNSTIISKRLKSPSNTAATTRSMIPASQRRKTVSHWETSAIIPREATHSHHDAALKSDMSLDLGDLNFDFSDTANETLPSLPVTSDRLLQYQQQRRRKTDHFARTEQPALSRSMRRLSFKDDPLLPSSPSVVSQKPQVKKEIKAGFYIGTPLPPSSQQQQQQQSQIPSSSSSTTAPSATSSHDNTISALSTSLPSLSSTSPVVLRRRRRSLSNRAALTPSSPPPLSSTATTATTNAFSRLLDKSKSSPLSSPSLKPPSPPKPPPATTTTTTNQIGTLDHPPFNDNERFPTIAMTSMNEKTKKKCINIIKKLGKYRLTSSVDEKTTHVIVGCQRRTESVILGLLNGAWLVTPDWILDSDKSNDYLDETEYEAILYFPRARAARRRDPLLPSTIHIYIRSTSKALAGGLVQQLVIKAGGHVVESMKEADIIISTTSLDSPLITVTENWLLDSIENWRYLATNRYHPPS